MNYTEILPFINTDKQQQAQALLAEGKRDSSPLIIKIIMGLGAWIASVSFIAFLYLAFSAFFASASALYIGILLIGLAFVLQHGFKSANVFKEQLVIAFMFAGKISLFLWFLYIFRGQNSQNIIFASLLGITAVSYPLFKNSADRFIGVFATLLFAYLCETMFSTPLFLWQVIPLRVFLALSIVGASFIFYFRKRSLYPIAYASLFAAVMPDILKDHGHNLTALIIAAAGFFILFRLHLYRTGKVKSISVLSAFAALAGLVLINIYIMTGAVLILLGCNFRDLKLRSLGYLSFIWGIIYFYMNLNTSLLNKSVILMLSGAVLLAAAQLIKKEAAK